MPRAKQTHIKSTACCVSWSRFWGHSIFTCIRCRWGCVHFHNFRLSNVEPHPASLRNDHTGRSTLFGVSTKRPCFENNAAQCLHSVSCNCIRACCVFLVAEVVAFPVAYNTCAPWRKHRETLPRAPSRPFNRPNNDNVSKSELRSIVVAR